MYLMERVAQTQGCSFTVGTARESRENGCCSRTLAGQVGRNLLVMYVKQLPKAAVRKRKPPARLSEKPSP
jgi:hypothetical protein